MKHYILRKRAIAALMRGLDHPEYREVMTICEGGRKHSSQEVHLSSQTLRKSAERAVKLYEAAKGWLSSAANVQVGLRGQCATTYYLYNDEAKGLEQMELGKPDEYDILYKGFQIDIKTFRWIGRTQDPNEWILVELGKFQSPSRKYPFYISCQAVSEEVIHILGFINRRDFERVGVVVGPPLYKTKFMAVKSLDYFTPIKELPEALKKERSHRAQTTLKRSTLMKSRKKPCSGQVT